MNRRKYYFADGSEICYHIEDILDEMKENEISEMKVSEAVIDHDSGCMWCSEHNAIVQHGSGFCGKDCEHYSPNNGKNGCCSHLGYCYNSGKEYTLYSDGRLEEVSK